MIIQSFNNIVSTYGTASRSPVQRQTSPVPTATYADKVSLSEAARAMMANMPPAVDSEIQKRLDAIKAKPGVERTQADSEYLAKNDPRYVALLDKIKAYGPNGTDALTADELDYMQKAGGFVNTMAELSPKEKALYDELLAKGDREAAHGLLKVGMARIGMSGQQVTLPNGKTFDPGNTEITAANIRNLFRHMFVDPSGATDRQFAALASYLDQRAASNREAGSSPA